MVIEDKKQCESCNCVLSIDSFYGKKAKNGRIYYDRLCLPCSKIERTKARYKKLYNYEGSVDNVKPCKGCATVKTLDEFGPSIYRYNNPSTLCNACVQKSNQRLTDRKDKYRKSIRRKFKLSHEESLLIDKLRHGDKCCLCLDRQRIAVDHDHETGDVRGLLCRECNMALGLIRENPATLRRMVTYLTCPKDFLSFQQLITHDWDQTTYDLDLLRLAYYQARNSDDPRTQNGAMVVNEGVILGQGFNHCIIKGQKKYSILNSPKKNLYMLHSEASAIWNALFSWGSLIEGGTLYGTWVCCFDCAKLIVASGIKEVVGHDLPAHHENSKWEESIGEAFSLLQDANVAVRLVKGSFDIDIKFNGKDIVV